MGQSDSIDPTYSRPYHLTNPSLNILFVDDHSETRHVVGRLLKMLGHEVTTADCVATALKAADESRFHLLISDIGLPDGNGHALLAELLARGPIVGIAMSGYGMAEDVEQSLEGGFTAHLVKPVTVAQLEQAIAQVKQRALIAAPDPLGELREPLGK
jgi:CheY-like chemotaxis protein